MIRFIDITRDYFAIDTNEPLDQPGERRLRVCAFANTVSDTFIEGPTGPMFTSMAEVCEIQPTEMAERCARLVRRGFFEDQKPLTDEEAAAWVREPKGEEEP